MPYEFRNGTPIYMQMVNIIRRKIVSSEWDSGQKIPTVRELAVEFGVNPNTVQRTMAELERDGLLYSERTLGRFVTDDKNKIKAVKDSMADNEIREFLERMQSIGYDKEYIIKRIKEI